ncbi:pentatricopeptide repeat-containing protein At1g12775, mitochondrial-like [Argentina anserina]|uniref:pentatricopeptide repeat-containing protein At1g12775, mitochondrial-like n=1 Tax=Argentina anserina TaxID=57926 RepID=UPI0021763FB6|nr:pentatricopeptide repeat-containing protein At1g12775, mitochondrial-like [Potentilla anserina]
MKRLYSNTLKPNQGDKKDIRAAKRNTSGATQLLRKIELSPDCKPDLVTYSIVINSLCNETLIADAFNLFSEMISKGIKADVITYTSLIDGVCKLGQWEQATRLLKEMASQHFPNVQTFNVLVDGLCKVGKVREAETVIQLMIQGDIEL